MPPPSHNAVAVHLTKYYSLFSEILRTFQICRKDDCPYALQPVNFKLTGEETEKREIESTMGHTNLGEQIKKKKKKREKHSNLSMHLTNTSNVAVRSQTICMYSMREILHKHPGKLAFPGCSQNIRRIILLHQNYLKVLSIKQN